MLTKLKKNEFNHFYKLLEDNFPIDEYRSMDEQKRLFLDNSYDIYAYRDKSNNIMACVSIWNFNQFIYVEHLVVDSLFKGQGLGTKILEELKLIHKQIILEVEPSTSSINERRIEFYKRCGFYLNNYDYTQPPLRDEGTWLNLQIMSYPYPLKKDEFDWLASEIREIVYNLKNGSSE